MEANPVPRPEPAAERAANMMRGLEWLMVPIVIALGFMLASFAVRNSEFWQHLATGRLISEGKYSFGQDPYSFETDGRYWVNHAWLYDVLLFKVYGLNESAVVYLKAALVAVLGLVMLLTCRPPAEQNIVPGTKANPTGWLAALAVGLALVAIAPKLALQPAIVSYLFLALALFILQNSPRWPAYALPVGLGVLMLFWVNFDQWFILGLGVTALYSLGEWLQQYFPGGVKTDPLRLQRLGIALGVAVAACLLNPHFVRVFATLPTELAPHVAPAMKADRAWSTLFISTSDVLYATRTEFGRSIPGYCYWAVLGLGLLGFGLNYQGIRAAHLAVWVGAAILPLLFNYGLIPFFVIVGAPIAVLNLHAFFARRPYRKGVKFVTADEPPEPAAAPGATSGSEGWWAGGTEQIPASLQAITTEPAPARPPATAASTTTAPAPASKALGGELQMTPETVLAMGGVMGRLLTVVLGLVALVCAYPGWLHAPTRNPRRVEWVIRPEAAYVQLAERLEQWHQQGKLPPDSRGMSLDLAVPNYCAWYAPSVRSFMDLRFNYLGHLSGDLLQVKRGLAERASEIDVPTDFRKPLRDHKINYLIVSTENELAGRELVLDQMLIEEEWALWYLNGRMAVFGWHDEPVPGESAAKDPMRMDLVALALGNKAERLKPGDEYGVVREPPPEAQPESTLLNRFLLPPAPPVPTESVSALLYWSMRDRAFVRAQRESLDAFDHAWPISGVASFAQPTLANYFLMNMAGGTRLPTAQRMALYHPLPAAVSILAVREARRATLKYPNDGFPYLVLSLAYNQMSPVGPELRRIQQLTALHQGLDRLPADEAERSAGPIVTTSWLSLVQLHLNYGERDLAEEALNQALKMYNRHPPLGVPEEQRDQHREKLGQMADRLKTELLAARDNYQLARDEAKRRNAPPQALVKIALDHGLVREALKTIEDPGVTRPDPVLWQQALNVYLDLGRIDEAQQILDKIPDHFKLSFRRHQIYAWIASGEYARAGKGLEELITIMEQQENKAQKFILAAKVFQTLHFGAVEPSAWPTMLATVPAGINTYINVWTGMEIDRSQKAELMAMRAILALEEGDIPTARKYFHDCTEMRANFDGLAYAAMYRRVLERAEAAK